MSGTSTEARAAHEGGHVIAAMLLGWTVDSATIDGPENCIDPLLVAVAEQRASDRQVAFRRLFGLRTYMTIVFAGAAAEATVVGVVRDSPVPGVLAVAKTELGGLLSDQEVEAVVGGAGTLAERIVTHAATADARARLSNALVELRTLTPSELDSIVTPVLPDYTDLFDESEWWTLRVGGS
ncbi:MAG: hypothetical protein M3256_24740 [Actinomycetota bacterium]|nr:hypothetical protein [Actinomycetota bacterium]